MQRTKARIWRFVHAPRPELSERERLRHPSWRRWTRKYAAKRHIVRDVWIVVGLAMLPLPLGAQLAIALPATLLSFLILDETP